MAYAVTDDIKRQNAIFKSLTEYQGTDAFTIRRALTEHEITADDARVRFLTLKAYGKAGGRTRSDLFAQGDGGVFIVDVDLLAQLVTAKLEKTAAKIRKEGWPWVEVRESFPYDEKSKFRQLREVPQPFAPDVQAEYDSLESEREALYDKPDDGDLTDDERSRIDEIDDRLEAIENAREYRWPEGAFDVAGAIVFIGYDGRLAIERGLVKPEDVKKLPKPGNASEADDAESASAGDKQVQRSGLSARLNTDLTKHRTAAISAEMIGHPDIALATIVHALAGQAFIERFHRGSCLEIVAKTSLQARDVPGDANDLIEKERSRWADKVPGDSQTLWRWCLKQDQGTLLDLLAFCVALTVDAVTPSGHGTRGDNLARALKLDMTRWFTPTAANFFGGVSKPQILAALQEAKGSIAPAWNKARKSELAAIAEREIAGTGWLPEILRAPADDLAQNDKAA